MQAASAYYRGIAERSRNMAKDMPDQDAKAHLLDMARQYDKLAKEAERQNG